MRSLADLVLRRVRLITALALIAGPWLIISYDISWHAALIAAVIAAAIAAAVLAIIWLSHGGGAGPRAKS